MWPQCWRYGGSMPYDGGWYGWMPFHGPLGLIVAILIIVGVVLLVRSLWRGRAAASAAIEALDVRYARGEIDRDTYIKMRKDLT